MYPFDSIALAALLVGTPSAVAVQILQILGALLLLTTFAVVATRLLSGAISSYAVQSFVLGLVAAVVAYFTGSNDLYIVAVLTIIVKCGAIVWILRNVTNRLHVQREVRPYLMETQVASVRPNAPLSEVIMYLIERGMKLLVVTNEEQHVSGVITLGHLLTQQDAYRHLDLLQMTGDAAKVAEFLLQFLTTEKTAVDVMITHPFVLTDSTTTENAARWMTVQHVTRMPVVDANGKLVGMVDQAHLLRYYTDLPEISERQAGTTGAQRTPRPRTIG